MPLSAVARPGQDGTVPESDRQCAERQAARRELVRMLRIVANTATYAAGQLADGIGPAEAAETAVFAAEQCEAMAVALRRMAEPPDGAAGRRDQARRLAALGVPQREIARRLGRSERSVREYVAGRGP